MSILWGTLIALLVIVWVITVADIVRRHLGPSRTAAWILIVVLLPFAGTILYLVLRKPTPDEIQRQVDAQNAMRGRDPTGFTRAPR